MATASFPFNPVDVISVPPPIGTAFSEAADAIASEALAGRLQDAGSFNWIESPDKFEALVPTHGNFAGPGYGAGIRNPTDEEVKNGKLATVTDPVTGQPRPDEIDIIAKPHDIAYGEAEKLTNFHEQMAKIMEADKALIDGTRAMLEKDSKGEIHLTDGERNYGKAMLALFEVKQFYINNGKVIIRSIEDMNRFMAVLYKVALNNALDTMRPYKPAADPYDTRRCHLPIDPNFRNSKSYRPVVDPFALDLDGDGIETTNVSSGILFDHNADGVKTGTGWIKSDDGLLVRDLNINGTIDSGRELFGDQTQLANGQIAANGSTALRDLDSNTDGIIDASDTAFNQLKVWRDLNQDGISQTEELQTLAEAGIASINLTATTKNQGQNGNTIASTGTYTKADGSTGTTGDVNLAINTATTQFTDEIEVPETLLDLPDMSGSGQVRDLQQAATLSPTLADLLTQYAAATTRETQLALLDQMLLAWADTSGMAGSLDDRAAGSYKVEYLNFGSISRSSHLQPNTATTAVTTSLTNAGFADGYDCVRERRVV